MGALPQPLIPRRYPQSDRGGLAACGAGREVDVHRAGAIGRYGGRGAIVAVMAKSAESVPPSVTVVNVRLDVPVLVTVTAIAPLVVPCAWFPKASGLGDAENTGPAVAPLIA